MRVQQASPLPEGWCPAALNQGWTYRDITHPDNHGMLISALMAERYAHSSEDVWLQRIAAGEIRFNGKLLLKDRPLPDQAELLWCRPRRACSEATNGPRCITASSKQRCGDCAAARPSRQGEVVFHCVAQVTLLLRHGALARATSKLASMSEACGAPRQVASSGRIFSPATSSSATNTLLQTHPKNGASRIVRLHHAPP